MEASFQWPCELLCGHRDLLAGRNKHVAKYFFDICNAEMAQWCQKSQNLDIQSQFFYVKKRPNLSKKQFSLKNINLGPHFFVKYIF